MEQEVITGRCPVCDGGGFRTVEDAPGITRTVSYDCRICNNTGEVEIRQGLIITTKE